MKRHHFPYRRYFDDDEIVLACPDCWRVTVTYSFEPSCHEDGSYWSGCCGDLYSCSSCGWEPDRRWTPPRRRDIARVRRIDQAARRRARRAA